MTQLQTELDSAQSYYHYLSATRQILVISYNSQLTLLLSVIYYYYYYYYYYYAKVNGYLNPSIITGENHRPDLLFPIQSKCLNVLELTVGFESNLNNNAVHKKEK